VRPLELTEVGSFDLETDVLVAGFGAAGSCAAHAAREVGAEVLVAERASGAGGAAALSEGIVYLGGGTPVQTACGLLPATFDDHEDDTIHEHELVNTVSPS
jgi:3-oxo-5alpha-steroid 4-dehydrogenase